MSDPITFVIPIYPGVTHLDFTGPHQFFARVPNAKVVVAATGGRKVTVDGLTFADLADVARIERCDVLCVPGGYGCTDAMRDQVYMDAIRRLAAGARYVTSVCTGSLVLGAAGLLEGRRAACHWAWRDLLSEFGAIPDPGRVVRDGNVLTGGGVTAGIDFALTLIAEIAGADVARSIQLALEYAPAPPFDSGRPDTAPKEILRTTLARIEPAMVQRRKSVNETAASMGR